MGEEEQGEGREVVQQASRQTCRQVGNGGTEKVLGMAVRYACLVPHVAMLLNTHTTSPYCVQARRAHNGSHIMACCRASPPHSPCFSRTRVPTSAT